jgi:hypothetical protein
MSNNQDDRPHPEQLDDRSEPFATVSELIAEHSELEILSAISDAALFDSEESENCLSCRLIAAKFHSELEDLLNRMGDFEELVSKCS